MQHDIIMNSCLPAGLTATQLTITGIPILNESIFNLCPDTDLMFECTVKNSSSIQWSSNTNTTSQPQPVLCENTDHPGPVDSIVIGGIQVDVEKNYSNETSILTCSLDVKAGELPRNQQLSVTCLNVDIGISATAFFQVIGIQSFSSHNNYYSIMPRPSPIYRMCAQINTVAIMC